MITLFAISWVQHPLLATAVRKAEDTGIHTLWEWMEENSLFTYPAIALSIIALIGGALIASWRSQAMSAEQKSVLKGKIMAIMRRRVSGVSPEAIAAELQIDVMTSAKLLSELTEEGVIAASHGGSSTDTARYRLKGLN